MGDFRFRLLLPAPTLAITSRYVLRADRRAGTGLGRSPLRKRGSVMDRRDFIAGCARVLAGAAGVAGFAGCRGHQYGQVLKPDQKDMVGSHAAGAETFNPLVDQAVAELLGRHAGGFQPAGYDPQKPPPTRPAEPVFRRRGEQERRGDRRLQGPDLPADRHANPPLRGLSPGQQAVRRRRPAADPPASRLAVRARRTCNCSSPRCSRWASRSTSCCTPRSPPERRKTITAISAITC